VGILRKVSREETREPTVQKPIAVATPIRATRSSGMGDSFIESMLSSATKLKRKSSRIQSGYELFLRITYAISATIAIIRKKI
jgi:hypothetical protein